MRATEIVRSILDLLDRLEQPTNSEHLGSADTDSRFRQIYAILQNRKPVSTEPNETVSGVDSVTTLAGGGVNGPKHADDIRVKDPRGYRQ